MRTWPLDTPLSHASAAHACKPLLPAAPPTSASCFSRSSVDLRASTAALATPSSRRMSPPFAACGARRLESGSIERARLPSSACLYLTLCIYTPDEVGDDAAHGASSCQSAPERSPSPAPLQLLLAAADESLFCCRWPSQCEARAPAAAPSLQRTSEGADPFPVRRLRTSTPPSWAMRCSQSDEHGDGIP
jgi:hypothetical protein